MSKTTVLFGGPSPEHDISILTGLQAAKALAGDGWEVGCVFWTKTGQFYSVANNLEAKEFVNGPPNGAKRVELQAGAGFVLSGRLGGAKTVDTGVVVVCCHGGPGEDGALQGVLDLAGIAYTGPSVASAALSMDKLAFAGVVHAAGLPSLPRVGASLDPGWTPGFDGPYMVKPRFGGSSIGVEVAADVATIRHLLQHSVHYANGAVVEPYLPESSDLQLGVRRYPNTQLSAIERPLRANDQREILNYADKYVGGEGMVSAPRELPAPIPSAMAEEIRRYAATVADLVLLRGIGRIDFLCDDGKIYVNEVNNPPGSLSHYLWIEPKIAFSKLLADMIAEATDVPSRTITTEGADGLALRSAGSIAAKLA